MVSLTVDFSEKILAAMRCTQEQFGREMRLAAAATWYEQGRISQEMAARVAGLSRTEFLLALARMGKDSFQVDWDDLNKELSLG